MSLAGLPANPGSGSEADDGSRAGDAFHRFLHDTDCSIAKDTRVVHYPTMHRDASQAEQLTLVWKDADYEFDELLVTSGFNFVRFIKPHRRVAAVFSEAHWTSGMVDEYRETRRTMRVISNRAPQIGQQFPGQRELLHSYDLRRIRSTLMKADEIADLDSTTSSLLEALTGADVAFMAGIIDDLFPSTTLGSVEEVFARFYAYYDLTEDPTVTVAKLDSQLRTLASRYNMADGEQAEVESEFAALQLRKLKIEKILHDAVFFWREYLLFRSVKEFLDDPRNQDRLVVISYGAGHDFSDEFKDYAFQTLPMACSISFDSVPPVGRFLFLVRMAEYRKAPEELAVLRLLIVDQWPDLSDSDIETYVAYREFQLDQQLARGVIDKRIHTAVLERIREEPLEHLKSELATRQAPVEELIQRAFDTYISVHR